MLNNTFLKFTLGFAAILTLSFGATVAIDRYVSAEGEVQLATVRDAAEQPTAASGAVRE